MEHEGNLTEFDRANGGSYGEPAMPTKPRRELKRQRLTVMLSPAEKDRFEAAAKKSRQSLSDWVRTRLHAEADRILEEVDA